MRRFARAGALRDRRRRAFRGRVPPEPPAPAGIRPGPALRLALAGGWPAGPRRPPPPPRARSLCLFRPPPPPPPPPADCAAASRPGGFQAGLAAGAGRDLDAAVPAAADVDDGLRQFLDPDHVHDRAYADA